MSAGKNGQQIMDDSIEKLLEGEPTETQVQEFEGKLSDEGKKKLRELMALKKQRKAEEDRVKKAKEDADAAEKRRQEADEAFRKSKEQQDESQTQFRKEQIEVAKQKFFSDYKIPPEEQAKYEAEFRDSGKASADLIFKDWVKTFAAVNSDSLIDAQNKQREMEKKAAEDAERQAGGHDSPPGDGGDGKPQHSKEAEELSKKAGISIEAAERQLKEGMNRVIG